MTPDELLDDHTPAVRALTQRLRRLVRSVGPEASERVYPGWHGLGFHHPDVGYFCGILPLADSVRLPFEHGALRPLAWLRVHRACIRGLHPKRDHAVEEMDFPQSRIGSKLSYTWEKTVSSWRTCEFWSINTLCVSALSVS